MTKSNELFTSMPVGKAVAKLAIPTVVSQIIVILYSLADTFFIGQIGDPNQIAALSITFPIYTLLTAVANLFGIGANSVIARSMGQNDEQTAKSTSSFAFWASLVVTGVLSVMLAVFMTPILQFFGANELTLGFTADYLFWVFVIGGIPTVAGLVLGHLVRAVGKTKEAGIGLTIGGVMNIILDPIFIFTFGMEVAGAALATMISNVISMLYFFVVLARIHRATVLTINPKHISLKKKVSFGTLSVGFPAAISVLLVCVSISLLNGLLLRHPGGNILSAAYGVTAKCGTIALHISIGIAQGVMPLIGYSYGAKDHKRVHDVCRLAFRILLVFSVVFLLIVQLVPGPIVRLFIDHQETIEVGSIFMRCWSWCVIGMSLFNMYNSIFQAVGKWKTSLLLAVLRLGVIFSVLSVVLNALFGVGGLMWVQAITDTASCLIAMALYERFKRSVVQEFSVQDGELIEKIAAESGLAKEYVEKYAGYTTSGDTADCLTVFIHASDEKRAERIVNVYGEREQSPVQRLHDKDNKRRAFYELYTGTQWGQADNYDLCLDSGKIGMDGCVNMIAQLYQRGA